jgi:hypothetical protein
MRRSIIVTGLAASVSMAAWCGSASAQGVGVDLYVGPSAYDGYYDDRSYSEYRYGPRVYGYYGERDERHLRRPEEYRTGSRRWWKQMDREGRGGQQD